MNENQHIQEIKTELKEFHNETEKQLMKLITSSVGIQGEIGYLKQEVVEVKEQLKELNGQVKENTGFRLMQQTSNKWMYALMTLIFIPTSLMFLNVVFDLF